MRLVTHDSLGPDCRCKPLALQAADGIVVTMRVFHHVDRVSQAVGLADCHIIWQAKEAAV